MAGLLDLFGMGEVSNGLLGGQDKREELQALMMALGGQ